MFNIENPESMSVWAKRRNKFLESINKLIISAENRKKLKSTKMLTNSKKN